MYLTSLFIQKIIKWYSNHGKPSLGDSVASSSTSRSLKPRKVNGLDLFAQKQGTAIKKAMAKPEGSAPAARLEAYRVAKKGAFNELTKEQRQGYEKDAEELNLKSKNKPDVAHISE